MTPIPVTAATFCPYLGRSRSRAPRVRDSQPPNRDSSPGPFARSFATFSIDRDSSPDPFARRPANRLPPERGCPCCSHNSRHRSQRHRRRRRRPSCRQPVATGGVRAAPTSTSMHGAVPAEPPPRSLPARPVPAPAPPRPSGTTQPTQGSFAVRLCRSRQYRCSCRQCRRLARAPRQGRRS